MAVNGGLFGYAGKAVGDTETEKKKEEELSKGERIKVGNTWYDSLQDVADEIPSDNQGDGDINSGIKNYNDTEKDDTKKGVLKANAYWIDYDEKGNEKARAVVPKGFKVIEGFKMVDGEKVATNSITDGLVIQDEEGNEFVWIPVEVKDTDTENSIASFYRSSWSENGRTTGISTTYTEPYASGYSEGKGTEENEDYYNMVKSVYLNKGFYIGRYEAGIKTTTGSARTSSTTETTTNWVVQKDCYPYTYVGWGFSMSNYTDNINTNGKGALYLSKAMYANKNVGVTSTLCYGVMWDAMLDYIKDDKHNVKNSTKWGNYTDNLWTIKNTKASYSEDKGETWKKIDDEENDSKSKTSTKSILLTTGADDSFAAKNIYDVAGNVYEWTNEAYSEYRRVIRGGGFNYDGDSSPASCRSNGYPVHSGGSDLGFRPALYISVGLDANSDDLAKTTE